MTTSEFLTQFREIDPHFTPAPAWWWSGEKLEITRMRWQMDQLHAMGIRNIVIINLAPSGTLFGSDPDDPPFLSEEWWSIFSQVCEHAKKLGIFLWFYDQIGFSGANFQAELVAANPQFAAEKLQSVSVEGVGHLTVEGPGGAEPIAAYAVAQAAPSEVRYLRIDNRQAFIDAGEPTKLVFVFKVRQGFDFLSFNACQKLLDTVHRQFESRLPQYLGSTILGSFQDELPELPTWGPTFAETFGKAYGYSLEKVIHRLFEPGDIQSRITRVHYHEHRATLAEEAMFKPFFEWHESHGLGCGFDQQSPAREARILGCVSKYADYTRTHQWYAMPGCDLHGNGKLHASIAFHHNRKRVWLEGFHSTGWGGTIADTFDWLLPYLQSGSNFYNPHAVYYSTCKGWWEWAPPSTCWRQPYAMHYAPFAGMIARLTKLLSHGVQQADVAVLFPTATVQSAMSPQKHFGDAEAADLALHDIIGSMRWHQVKIGVLDELKIEFHLVDEPAICNSELAEGAFVQLDVKLKVLVLPHTTMLADATVEKIRAFAGQGGRVIAVGSDRIETLSGRTFNVNDLPNAHCVSRAEDLAAAIEGVSRSITAPVPTLYRKCGDLNILFVPASNGMATVVKWDNWFAPQEHTTIVPDRYAKSMEVTLPAGAGPVFRFDPSTGSVNAVQKTSAKVQLDMNGAPFALLVWSDKEPPTGIAAPEAHMPPLAISDEWACEYLPTLPDMHADIYDPKRPWQRWPHTVELKWKAAEGDTSWAGGIPVKVETVHSTFGVRAWKQTSGAVDQPLVYSPEFGIHQDRLHQMTLGPKGHVPEEFLDLGKLLAGERVKVKTGVQSDVARDAVLVMGANAIKSARVNGVPWEQSEPAYPTMMPVQLQAGENPIELTLTAERDGTIRLFWCLVDPSKADAMKRPERIFHGGKAIAGSTVSYVHEMTLGEPATGGSLKLSVAALARLFLDDQLLGLQGGCDPYRPNMRGQTIALPAAAAGRHTVRIDLLESSGAAAIVVDGYWQTSSGNRIPIYSNAAWMFQRDAGKAVPVQVWTRQENDGAAWQLSRRPHPLPRTNWLEAKSDVVLDLPLLPPSREVVAQWFEWMIPPGARQMHLPLVDVAEIALWIDGKPQSVSNGQVQLGDRAAPARKAVLFVRSRQLKGGVFASAITYEFGTGIIRSGDWCQQGLRSYSGAIRMRQTIHVLKISVGLTIDLGHVRGTVEAKLNGKTLGVKFMSPYRFDISQHVREGENELELIVTNTLANFLSTWSPSRGWSPDQLVCGIDLKL